MTGFGEGGIWQNVERLAMDVAIVGRIDGIVVIRHDGDGQFPTAIIGADAVHLGVCLIEKTALGDDHRNVAMEGVELTWVQCFTNRSSDSERSVKSIVHVPSLRHVGSRVELPRLDYIICQVSEHFSFFSHLSPAMR